MGYKYCNRVRSTKDDLRNLVHDITLLNTAYFKLVTRSSSANLESIFNSLVDQNVLIECEEVLYIIQALLNAYNLASEKRQPALLTSKLGH